MTDRQPSHRRGHFWRSLIFLRGFVRAFADPGVQMLLALTASVVLGGAIFYWLVERWTFVDALYFATVTISTVGYGDFTPTTDLAKIFTIGYIVVGVGLFVALASAFAHHVILRAREDLGLGGDDF